MCCACFTERQAWQAEGGAREGCRGGEAHLNGAIGSYKLIFEVRRPKAQACEVHQQMLVHHSELSTQHPPHIYVACVRLKALVVAQYLQKQAAEAFRSLWGVGKRGWEGRESGVGCL